MEDISFYLLSEQWSDVNCVKTILSNLLLLNFINEIGRNRELTMQLFLPNQLRMNEIWICGYIPYKRLNMANYDLEGTNRNSSLSMLRFY